MKILVLSCNTGGGHNAAAHAIVEQFARMGVPCEFRDALRFQSERTSRIVSDVYVRTVTAAPRVFGFGYRLAEAIGSPRYKSPVYFGNIPYARAMYAYISENRFDAVVMPHLFPAEAITHVKRRFGCAARTYLVSTDYVCCPFFEETEVDRFCIPHAALRPEFVRRGIPDEKLAVTGIPVSERYCTRMDRAGARRELGLDAPGRAILIMTGSMGFGNVERLIRPLMANLSADDRVLVLGGNNEAMKRALRDKFRDDARVGVLDFTDRVDLYMDACDMLFTKPGGLTTTEAAVKGVPLVHTGPIPGCETLNLRFFGERGMSVSAESPEETVAKAIRLLNDPAACRKMIERQRENINPRAAQEICELVLSDIG